MIPHHFHPEAEEELSETASFYESRVQDLGFRFLDELQRRVTSIREHPEIGFSLGQKLRVVPLHGFPYSVIYHFNGTDIRILAVAAQARRPGYWRTRKVAR